MNLSYETSLLLLFVLFSYYFGSHLWCSEITPGDARLEWGTKYNARD